MRQDWRGPSATAAQATNLSQQVRAAAEASATSVNLQGTDCYFTSIFCVLCKLPLISGLTWNHNEEGIWRQKLQSGSVDTIESHPSCMFWVQLRKAAQRSRAQQCGSAWQLSGPPAWACAQYVPALHLREKLISVHGQGSGKADPPILCVGEHQPRTKCLHIQGLVAPSLDVPDTQNTPENGRHIISPHCFPFGMFEIES